MKAKEVGRRGKIGGLCRCVYTEDGRDTAMSV